MHPVLIAQDYVRQHSQLLNEFKKENISFTTCKNTEIDISVSLVSKDPDVIILNASKLGHEALMNICTVHRYTIRPGRIINIYTYEDPEELAVLYNMGIKESHPFPYDPALIIKYIRELRSVVPKDLKELIQKISEKIDSVMFDVNPSGKQRGNLYIRDAVLILLFEPHFKVNLHSDIYKRIAEKYSTSVKSVEHSIRITITSCWEKADAQTLRLLTDHTFTDCRRPTNYSFIAALAQKIYRDNKEYFDMFSDKMNNTSFKLHI